MSVGWNKADLAELRDDLPEEAVQDGQLAAQVDVALEAARVAHAVQVGDLVKELLHGAPLHLQELIHENHVILFIAKPAHGKRRKGRWGGEKGERRENVEKMANYMSTGVPVYDWWWFIWIYEELNMSRTHLTETNSLWEIMEQYSRQNNAIMEMCERCTLLFISNWE